MGTLVATREQATLFLTSRPIVVRLSHRPSTQTEHIQRPPPPKSLLRNPTPTRSLVTMSSSAFHRSTTADSCKRPFLPSHSDQQLQQCKPSAYLFHQYSNYNTGHEQQQHLNLDFNDPVFRPIFAGMPAIADDNCSSCCDNDNCVDKCENDDYYDDCTDECHIDVVAHCSLDDCKVASASSSASSCPGSPCAQSTGGACQTVLCEDEVCSVDPGACGVACVETVYCHDTACKEEECRTLPCEVPCEVSDCSQAIYREYSCHRDNTPAATTTHEPSLDASYHGGGGGAHNCVSFHVNNANSNRWRKSAPRLTETEHYASIAPNSLTLDTARLQPPNTLLGDPLYSAGGGTGVPRWFRETESPPQPPSKRRRTPESTPAATPAFDRNYSTTPSSAVPTPVSSNLGDIDCLWDYSCDETFFDNLALQDHIQHAHIGGTQQLDVLTCLWDGCGQETSDPNSLFDHVKYFHAPPPGKLICMWEGCRATASSESELQSHINTAHLPLGSQCKWDACDLLAPDLEKHVQTQHLVPQLEKSSGASTGTAARACQWQDTDRDGNFHTCGMLFNSSTDLQQHAKDVHIHALRKKTGYFCRWAGCSRGDKPFSQKGKVERHFQTHTGCKYPPPAPPRHTVLTPWGLQSRVAHARNAARNSQRHRHCSSTYVRTRARSHTDAT